jgi:hypothetical protein
MKDTLYIKSKYIVEEIANKNLALVKKTKCQVGDILEVSIPLESCAGYANYADVVNLNNGMEYKNVSLVVFSKQINWQGGVTLKLIEKN